MSIEKMQDFERELARDRVGKPGLCSCSPENSSCDYSILAILYVKLVQFLIVEIFICCD
jgi:hypothetical protein